MKNKGYLSVSFLGLSNDTKNSFLKILNILKHQENIFFSLIEDKNREDSQQKGFVVYEHSEILPFLSLKNINEIANLESILDHDKNQEKNSNIFIYILDNYQNLDENTGKIFKNIYLKFQSYLNNNMFILVDTTNLQVDDDEIQYLIFEHFRVQLTPLFNKKNMKFEQEIYDKRVFFANFRRLSELVEQNKSSLSQELSNELNKSRLDIFLREIKIFWQKIREKNMKEQPFESIQSAEKNSVLKWFSVENIERDLFIKKQVERVIKYGSPSDRFLWPIALASIPDDQGFGYVMEIKGNRHYNYKNINQFIEQCLFQDKPNFRALTTAGFELASSFFDLHERGLCYYDINLDNIFFDDDGHVLISYNNNIDFENQDRENSKTIRFMAPEIIRGESKPNLKTDLYSLAVLLFYLLFGRHPLEGKQKSENQNLDVQGEKELYGIEPVFIHDPEDDSNKTTSTDHTLNNVLDCWSKKIYPQFLLDLFTTIFTHGLHNPNARISVFDWQIAMVKLRDLIIYCAEKNCFDTHKNIPTDNFYHPELYRETEVQALCWRCKQQFTIPPRIIIDDNILCLNPNTKLFPHHINKQKLFDFSQCVGEIVRNGNKWEIRNISLDSWKVIKLDGESMDIEQGNTLGIKTENQIIFGDVEGIIKWKNQ